MTRLGILDLLAHCGFARSCRAKLVRHQDQRYDVHELLRSGWLETYQSYQSKPVFSGVEYIISFVGVGGTAARLVGVYRVAGPPCPSGEVPVPRGCPYPEWQQSELYYDLRRQEAFEEFENRAVIDWGGGTLAWHQWATNKQVIEILARGHLLQPFRDYLEFCLTFDELKHLYHHQNANSEWRSRLSAVAGVYLVLASTTGAQYVGSAYGAEGIWGRWSQYAKNGHGGNALLQELVQKDEAYPRAFSFSILQILPRTFTWAEVWNWEKRYKIKLGSRATGLNGN